MSRLFSQRQPSDYIFKTARAASARLIEVDNLWNGVWLRRVDLSVWSRRPTAVSFVMCLLQASLPTVFCSSSHSEMLAELKVHIVDFLLVCVKRVFLLALCCIFT